MITLFTGKPGSGKTYQLTKILVNELAQGKNVYTNIDFNVPLYNSKIIAYNNRFFRIGRKRKLLPVEKYHYFDYLREYLDCTSGTIIWDEAHAYFNSRAWKDMPESWIRKISQHRKHGLNIYGSVQRLGSLDVTIREMVNFLYNCRMLIQLFPSMSRPYFSLYQVSKIDLDDELMMDKKTQGTTFRLIRPKYADCYDTLQSIEISK